MMVMPALSMCLSSLNPPSFLPFRLISLLFLVSSFVVIHWIYKLWNVALTADVVFCGERCFRSRCSPTRCCFRHNDGDLTSVGVVRS